MDIFQDKTAIPETPGIDGGIDRQERLDMIRQRTRHKMGTILGILADIDHENIRNRSGQEDTTQRD